jgi:Protein of unknown function (DUF4241)
MDEAAIEALLAHIVAEDDEEYLLQRVDALGPVGGPEWFDSPLDVEAGANLLLCTSGWGDGVYSSSWGFDADGNVAYLLKDLRVVDASDFV